MFREIAQLIAGENSKFDQKWRIWYNIHIHNFELELFEICLLILSTKYIEN